MLPPEPAASWRGAGGELQGSEQEKHPGSGCREGGQRIGISQPSNNVTGRSPVTFLRKYFHVAMKTLTIMSND